MSGSRIGVVVLEDLFDGQTEHAADAEASLAERLLAILDGRTR